MEKRTYEFWVVWVEREVLVCRVKHQRGIDVDFYVVYGLHSTPSVPVNPNHQSADTHLSRRLIRIPLPHTFFNDSMYLHNTLQRRPHQPLPDRFRPRGILGINDELNRPEAVAEGKERQRGICFPFGDEPAGDCYRFGEERAVEGCCFVG